MTPLAVAAYALAPLLGLTENIVILLWFISRLRQDRAVKNTVHHYTQRRRRRLLRPLIVPLSALTMGAYALSGHMLDTGLWAAVTAMNTVTVAIDKRRDDDDDDDDPWKKMRKRAKQWLRNRIHLHTPVPEGT